MKMLPSHIWNNSPHKKGESQVFALLSAINLSNFCVALHTQNIHGGKKQAWHELDFLVLTERAILGVEVKAARAVCVDGVWFFYNKDGSIAYKKYKSPLVQASDALEQFRAGWLRTRFGERFRKIPFVKTAILCSNPRPDPVLRPMGPELLDELTIYEEDLTPNRLKEKLNSVIDYHISKGHPGSALTMCSADIDELSFAIRPDLDLSYPSRAAGEAIRRRQEELTDEQYRFADAIQNSERFILDGGAGTGKSFLLIYDANRAISEKKRVGVLVPSVELALYLTDKLAGSVSCYTRETLPRTAQFDVLYVDEAQDFVNEDDFSLLDVSLVGGMSKGCWRLYGDFENQLSPDTVIDADVWKLLLLCTGNNTVYPLTRNVRNTSEIVKWLESICGARIGATSSLGAGSEVEVISGKEFWNLMTGKTHHGIYGNPSWDEVTVLYPERIKQSRKNEINSSFRNKCHVCSIAEFRGLESNIIFICGLDEIASFEHLRDQSYKGVSRARNLCFIEGDDETLNQFLELMRLSNAN